MGLALAGWLPITDLGFSTALFFQDGVVPVPPIGKEQQLDGMTD
jgi:hypothetical protein